MEIFTVCVSVSVCVCVSVCVSKKFALNWESPHGAHGKAQWGTIGRAIGGPGQPQKKTIQK